MKRIVRVPSFFFFFQNQRSPPRAISSFTYCRNIPAASTSSKSGLQRTRLALIFSLDFTPLHQDKLMKVKSPPPLPPPPRQLSPSGAVLFISHLRSGGDSCNPICVTHCLYNCSRGYGEQHRPPKSHSRCREKQITHWQVYLSLLPLFVKKNRQYVRGSSMTCFLTSPQV